jgi:thioredoxin reductase (NADPH)
MSTTYDIAVIGAGPAGLSAAITARARDKQVVVVSNKPQQNPLAKSKLVDNYPGLPGVSGLELLEQMHAHAHNMGVVFEYARVISVLPMGSEQAPRFSVTTSDDIIDARTVIVCVGTAAAKPFAGEQEYLGRGVSYCATCDGMLYRTATVCVVGLEADAPEEAGFLAGIGARVHYVAAKLPVELPEGIFAHEGRALAIEGDAMGVTGLRIAEKDGEDSNEKLIECAGVFILRPSIAPSALLPTLELADGYIAVDGQMRTSVAGVFAAGDCTGKPLQVAKAVGDAQKATFAAGEVLDKLD